MLVDRLELHAFMGHDNTVLPLPPRGVVLVTGDNGAGKSTLLEAVSWGAWGRTLRGSNPWRGEPGAAPCWVRLQGPAVDVRRDRAGRKSSLTWHRPDDAPVEYETATKAQAALETELGTHDMWHRTHVFTSADAWAFASATDAARKVMLEAILGLDLFDAALDRCRVDLREVTASLAREEQALSRVRGSLDVARGQVEVARQSQGAEPEDAGPLVLETARLDRALDLIAADLVSLVDVRRVHERAEARAMHTLGDVHKRALGVSANTCDACGQEVSAAYAEAVRVQAGPVETEATDALLAAREGLARVQAERAACDRDAGTLRARRDALLRRQEAVRAARAAHDKWAEVLAGAEGQLAAFVAEEGHRVARVAELTGRVEDLRVAEQVLGLRGVRAQVLDGALHAVERVANVWLTRFAGEGVELKLRSRTALKGGGTADTIAVEVVGFGGAEGYAGASVGERRRVDVAIMLSLAEIMRARAGAAAGTLFFDEVFDVLDPDGVDAVCAALREVAEDRPVVVITHNAALAARISPAVHLHAVNGRFTPGR